MTITIRPEQPGDAPQVRTVNLRAFGQPLEADLVDTLRRTCDDRLSLVATRGDAIIGHILFTPVTIDGQDSVAGAVAGMGLAPMAVVPDQQRRGIGGRLVTRGLEILAGRACPFVVVVGHPDYYPRFGFERASAHRLHCQWDGVPDDAFMVRVLDAQTMARVSGLARYREEFDAVA